MNLYLHRNPKSDPCPIEVLALTAWPWTHKRGLVSCSPIHPFGRKSTIATTNDAGIIEKDEAVYRRTDFWAPTKNKQLNFLQHAKAAVAG